MVSCRFQQCLGPFTMLLLVRSSETGLFRHLFNYAFWSPYFRQFISYEVHMFFKCSKFNLDLENGKNKREKVCCFLDNWIWIGCVKLTQWRREYLPSAVKVLTNSSKILHSLRETFSNPIAFTFINKYRKHAVVQISTVFGTVYYVACSRVFWNGTS